MNFLHTKYLLRALALATLATPIGCDDPEDLGADEAFGAGEVSERCFNCGIKFNTNAIGKYALSELSTIYGTWHNGAVLHGVDLYRLGATTAVFAKGGQLYAKYNGQTLPDKYLLNSKWTLEVVMEGVKTPAVMRITDIATVEGNRVYTFTHQYSGGPKDPLPNCDEDPDSPGVQYGAIVSGNITVNTKTGDIDARDNTLYIGCLSGAVAKTAKWGYPEHVVGLTAFEAGVRMVRADYCGNGYSFTIPGNPVELTDAWWINDFPSPAAPTEAVWGKAGARCIGTPRHPAAYPTALSVQKKCGDLGAPVPVECKSTDDLASYGGLSCTNNPSPPPGAPASRRRAAPTSPDDETCRRRAAGGVRIRTVGFFGLPAIDRSPSITNLVKRRGGANSHDDLSRQPIPSCPCSDDPGGPGRL